MKWCVAVLLIIAGSGNLFAEDVLSLDNKRESLSFGRYTFRKLYDKVAQRWTFRVSKNGQFIRSFGNPKPNELDRPEDGSHLSIGTVQAVSGTSGQVAIRVWTGGTKCCNIHWIVGFNPEPRVLLDTSQFRFDGLEFGRDIDGDGDTEFAFGTTTFDYFGAGYAFSPRAHAWFKFDRKSGSFIPANELCFSEIEKQIKTDETKLHAHGRGATLAPDNQEFRQILLDIVLAFLYAGRERQAWAFFEREYREPDRDQLRKAVERQVKTDPYFRAFLMHKDHR